MVTLMCLWVSTVVAWKSDYDNFTETSISVFGCFTIPTKLVCLDFNVFASVISLDV